MRLGALLAKDARVLARNRALLAALLAYPILLMVVLNAAFQEPPQRLDLVVVDEEREGASVDLAGEPVGTDAILAAAGAFADVVRVADEEEGLRRLRSGEADALLVVPRGFLVDLAGLGTNATLRLVVDESDPVRAGVARNAVEGAIEAFVARIVQEKIDDVRRLLELTVEGGSARVAFLDVQILGLEATRARLQEVLATLDPETAEAEKLRESIGFLDFASGFLGDSERYLTSTALPLRVETSGLAARDTDLADVALPGAVVLALFWTGALAAALLSARERETGVQRRLAAAPGARWPFVASKLLVALAAGLVPAALLALGGSLYLASPVASPALVLLALALGALAAAALGILASALARATSGAVLLAVLLLLPMLLLGGLFFPVAYMPEGAQALARALPVTQATEALRGAMLRGSSLAELAPALGLLTGFAVAAGGLGVALQRRTA